ncbi:MAG: outer membrane lipoprotein carrier protein LolA [Chromatiales bacterium 21-64-14]|nr:MAG: outer membrane lipoprotein carrier protein LolA [Chromatiales bacterium 21-64-14]HQU15667.1 outer membrane lipoprotein chaperone LolA [Gammaproteobacteria bacterium]
MPGTKRPAVWPVVLMLGMVLTAGYAAAAARPDPAHPLAAFLDGLQTLRADFAQSVVDDRGQVVQKSRGTLYLERPGRFRWDYQEPPELIVADGKRLWFYDSGLEQVTVRPLEQGLGDLPVALLTSTRSVETRFHIRDLGIGDGLHWLRLIPRTKGSGFDWMRLGFRGDLLVRMQLRDSLGQTTRIAFTQVQRNPKLDPKLFQFTPPPGVDVIGNPGPVPGRPASGGAPSSTNPR